MGPTRPIPGTVIVGAGRAGLTLATALARSGGGAVSLVCRNRNRRVRIGDFASTHGLALLPVASAAEAAPASVVIFATADRDLREAATEVAGSPTAGVWLHLSGMADPGVLRVPSGAPHVGSCHPLCAIPDPLEVAGARPSEITVENVVRPLRAALFIVAGDPVAAEVASDLAVACGGRPYPLALEGRAAYHAAAAIVANDLVALIGTAEKLCRCAGLEGPVARPALLHLARTALEALQATATGEGRSLVDGLTGAVGRGDAGTLAAHLEALAEDPRGRAVHALLSTILLELVGDRLAPPQRRAVLSALHGATKGGT